MLPYLKFDCTLLALSIEFSAMSALPHRHTRAVLVSSARLQDRSRSYPTPAIHLRGRANPHPSRETVQANKRSVRPSLPCQSALPRACLRMDVTSLWKAHSSPVPFGYLPSRCEHSDRTHCGYWNKVIYSRGYSVLSFTQYPNLYLYVRKTVKRQYCQ